MSVHLGAGEVTQALEARPWNWPAVEVGFSNDSIRPLALAV